MELSLQDRRVFQETLWDYYAAHGRDLPWRMPEPDGSFDPYKTMVSELMLQQTQVPRVIPKYRAFLGRFPDARVLASADLSEVLRAWQGLGYNRRAKFLWQAARKIVDSVNYFADDAAAGRAVPGIPAGRSTAPAAPDAPPGVFPDTPAGLIALPGIGPNTAGAILAYAFNRPAIFIETNVRSVYLHHFFRDRTDVPDSEIRGLLEQTLDRENPREFYWALMDYGSHLKATVGNPNRASRHYVRQSRFHGSRRQLRGQVIRLLGERPYTAAALAAAVADERLAGVLAELTAEGLIRQSGQHYTL